jgi:hypothetical protein
LIIWVSLASVTTAHAEGTNIVPNPGFEDENEARKGTPKAWGTDWTRFNTNAFWTREDVHSGQYSVKLILTNMNANGISWCTPLFPVKSNTCYKFSVWAKCLETSQYGLLITIVFYDKDKQLPGDEAGRKKWFLRVQQAGTFNWHKFSRRHRTSPEACYASICMLFAYGAGQVYYDDVSLVAEEK